MISNHSKDNLLSSWKEIAAYLGNDEKTCYRWEKNFGLPVHRIEGALKSRVYAYKDELDKWRQEKTTYANKVLSKPLRSGAIRRSRWHKSYYLSPLILAGLLIFIFFAKMPGSQEPANFKILNSRLLILNEEGKELWQFATGLENLEEEKTYREHFQFKRKGEASPTLPYLIIKDINNDGHKEVLFSTKTQDATNEGDLLCFSHKGKKLWKYRGGREIKFGSKTYSADFRTRGFDASDLNEDGKFEIIAIFQHRPNWPTQLAVLDCTGHAMGEYWNSGHLGDLVFIDLDEDGKKEIVAAGLNNEFAKGCLVIFDSSSIVGGSPNSGEFKCEELSQGSEKYYLLFPRTDVDLQEYPFESIQTIDILENRQLSAMASISFLIFELNYKMVPQDIIISHAFIQKHRTALASGKIKSEINGLYKEGLMKGFFFWDGQGWTNKPSMSLFWEEAKKVISTSK